MEYSVFGELTVTGFAGRNYNRHALWTCVCSCGNTKIVRGYDLKHNITRTCGNCRWYEKYPSEYDAWRSMHQRCYNEKKENYKDYGGRGIKVCKRWFSFKNFLDDMGPKPFPGLSIDRNNNDGDYEPGNCSWETYHQQALNRRPKSQGIT